MVHYYDEEQTGPFQPFLIPIKLKDISFNVYSASGIFSLKHLDLGTETLLKYCVTPNKGRVLDLGCGYGVVGLATKLRNPDLEVVLCDVNERALKLSRKNAQHLRLDVHVVKSNLFSNVHMFDCILTNPPYVAGRGTLFKLITDAKDHLVPDGTLQLVARHQKGGKVLESKMKEVFGEENVSVLGKGAGFRVYCAKNTL